MEGAGQQRTPWFGDDLFWVQAMGRLNRPGEAIAAYDAAAGNLEAMEHAVSDDFLEQLTAVGDEPLVRGGVTRYREAGATSPCIGPIPKTDFEATLRAGIGS